MYIKKYIVIAPSYSALLALVTTIKEKKTVGVIIVICLRNLVPSW